MPGETNIQLRLIVREFNGCRSSLIFEIYLESDQKLNESAFCCYKIGFNFFAVIYILTPRWTPRHLGIPLKNRLLILKIIKTLASII